MATLAAAAPVQGASGEQAGSDPRSADQAGLPGAFVDGILTGEWRDRLVCRAAGSASPLTFGAALPVDRDLPSGEQRAGSGLLLGQGDDLAEGDPQREQSDEVFPHC